MHERTHAVAVNQVITTVTNKTLMVDINVGHNYPHITFGVVVTLHVLHRLTHLGVSLSHISGFQGVGDLTFHGSAGTLHITHNGVWDLHAFSFAVDA